ARTISGTEQKLKSQAESSAQTIEQTQGRMQEKIRAYAEQAAKAQQQAQSETEQRSRAEARIQDLTRAIAAAEKRLRPQIEAQVLTPIEEELEARQKMRVSTHRISAARRTADTSAQERAEPHRPPIEIVSIPTETVTCECCGRKNIAEDQSVRIDSGQVFCQDCFSALSRSSLV
ncbi:MAG TPA: hypothetical protein VMX13_10810, partial [Sedimentisphaerales bacterium]|nr:hypothetical protein [Sedimentisphaerales bacterium]